MTEDDLVYMRCQSCLWCKIDIFALVPLHKDEKKLCKERNNKAKRGWASYLIPFWTCRNLLFNAQEDTLATPLPSSLSRCCICAGQKLKMSISSGLRLLGELPMALSQSGWVNQSWGVSPVSRTWGLVRDLARLRIQAKSNWSCMFFSSLGCISKMISIGKQSDIIACCWSGIRCNGDI